MFRLHMDLHLHYVPPITEAGPGIIMTREIEIPFPAFEGLRVYSPAFDDCPDPMGFTLKEVVWDVDRQVFLADTYLASHDLPMAFIADDIRAWLGRGWRLGSFCDDYPEPDYSDEEPADGDGDTDASAANDDLERLHTLAPQRRPKEFNQVLKALVRHMAETFNNSAAAYAMDKTGRFFSDDDIKARPTDPAVRRWQELCSEFTRFSDDEQFAWRDRAAKYRSIEAIIMKG